MNKLSINLNASGRGTLAVDGHDLSGIVSGFSVSSTAGEGASIQLCVEPLQLELQTENEIEITVGDMDATQRWLTWEIFEQLFSLFQREPLYHEKLASLCTTLSADPPPHQE